MDRPLVIAAPSTVARSPYLQRLAIGPAGGHGPLIHAALGQNADPALIQTLSDALDYHMVDPEPGTIRRARAGGWPHVPRVQPGRACALAVLDEGLPVTGLIRAGRLASLWVQDGRARLGSPPWLPFGREAGGAALERLLDLDPTTAYLRGISVVHDAAAGPPGQRPGTRGRLLRRATHGAAVLHEAVRGLGPAHPVIAVGFPAQAVRDTSGGQLPYYALTGLLHAMAVTRAIGVRSGGAVPLVATLSYGVLAGSKDGTSPFARALDAIADPDRTDAGLGPVHLVLPMGNGRQAACVARLDHDCDTVDLVLLPDDHTPTFLEVRGTGPIDITVDGHSVASGEADAVTVTSLQGHGGMPGLLLTFPATAPSGARPWSAPRRRTLRLTQGSGPLDLMIQRGDSLSGLASGGRQAHFTHPAYGTHDAAGRIIARDTPGLRAPITRAGTFNAFAGGQHIWRVGGCYLHGNKDSVPYSGLGYPGRDRPDEGDILMACDDSTRRWGRLVASVAGNAPVRMNGTSIAAPIAARHLAIRMAQPGPVPSRAALTAILRDQLADPRRHDALDPASRRILHDA
jgi:hypothetical protein